jgi:ADP-heptose:LPS heptosyltransferase
MAGLTTMRQAARLIKECALFIGNDSGLLHAAAMMRVPAIGIFGPTNPMHHGPAGESLTAVYRGVECAPCASPECALDDEQLFCLTSVPVEEIFNNAKRILP